MKRTSTWSPVTRGGPRAPAAGRRGSRRRRATGRTGAGAAAGWRRTPSGLPLPRPLLGVGRAEVLGDALEHEAAHRAGRAGSGGAGVVGPGRALPAAAGGPTAG